jgi:hypothetical protein
VDRGHPRKREVAGLSIGCPAYSEGSDNLHNLAAGHVGQARTLSPLLSSASTNNVLTTMWNKLKLLSHYSTLLSLRTFFQLVQPINANIHDS